MPKKKMMLYSLTARGGGGSNDQPSQRVTNFLTLYFPSSITGKWKITLDLYSCIEQGIGLDGIIAPF